MPEPTPLDIARSINEDLRANDRGAVVRGLDGDKQKAADSVGVSQNTGDDPNVIYSDFDRFMKRRKGEVAQSFVEDNPVLREYVRTHPLGATVSKDDWGALSDYTNKIKDFNKYAENNIPSWLQYAPPLMAARIMPEMIEDIKGGIKNLSNVFTPPEQREEPEEEKLPSHYPPELQRKLDEYARKHTSQNVPYDVAFGIMQIIGSPFSAALRSEIYRPLSNVTGIREDLIEGYSNMALMALPAFKKGPSGVRGPIAKMEAAQVEARKAAETRQLRQVLDKAQRVFERAEIWAKTGERPPIGADPALDQLIGLESINRLTALDAVMEGRKKAETMELSPESWAELNKIAFRDKGSIYLRWDAAKSLYGENLPEAGDKKLGDISGVYDQFTRSRDITGEPIEIPLSELPGIDPEVYKLIKDDLHFEGGMTRKVAEELVKAEPQISTIPETAFPGFADEIRRPYKLEDVGEGLHDIIDEAGNKTAQIRIIEQDGGKNLFIGWEKGQYDVSGLRTLMDQLKEKYPKAETISTVRVPGVESLERGLQGSDIAIDMPFRIRDRPVDVIRGAAGLRPLFDLPTEGPRAIRIVPGTHGVKYMGYGRDAFTITDEMGRPVAGLELTPRADGKEIDVGWIGRSEGDISRRERLGTLINRLGPTLVRSLVQQLKEMYPDAEYITGTRISGARERRELARERIESEEVMRGERRQVSIWSGDRVKIPIKKLLDEMEEMPAGWHPMEVLGPETNKFIELLAQGYERVGEDLYAKRVEPWSVEELQLEGSIGKFLNKIIGENVARIVGAEELMDVLPSGEARNIRGFFEAYRNSKPLIAWSLTAESPFETAGHEAIHFLRHFKIITEAEWETLRTAAIEQGWTETPEMRRYERYRHSNPELFVEEAIADEFKRYARMSQEEQKLHGVAKIMAKIREIVDAIKSGYREWKGREATAEEIFRDIQIGRMAERMPGVPLTEVPFSIKGRADIPEERPPPIEEKVPTFEPGAIMDKKKYAKYQRLMNEQNAEDIRKERETAVREANRRNAPEWAANRATMREGVVNELGARPNFRARAFFQNGTFYGQETHFMPKVDPKFLTKEQRAKLPARWQERGGMDPDALSNSLGYPTGEAMINDLIKFEKDKGKLTPREFFEKTVDAETDRRMELRYGNLAEKNLQEAMDHVVGHTQFELLTEEMMALAMRAGQKLSLSKENVRSNAITAFLGMKQTKAGYKYLMQELYRTGKEAETAFLRGDYISAFRSKEQQVNLFQQAREVKQLDKERAALERVTKRFYKRYPENFPAEFTEFIQALMRRGGYEVDRGPGDLERMMEVRDHKGDLRKFVDTMNELPPESDKFEGALNPYLVIPDFILDGWPDWKKDVRDMTVGEFKAFNGALQSLQKIGADQGKLHRLGEEADLQKKLEGAKEQLELVGPAKPPRAPGKRRLLHQWYHVGTIRPEDLLLRLDKGNERGFFTQFITDPLNDRAYVFDQMYKEFRQKRVDIDKKYGATTNRSVDNTVFRDPRYMVKDPATGKMMADPTGGDLLPLTQQHVRGVLLNWGNKSNRDRVVEGFNVSEKEIEAWLRKVATKDDWNWAREMGGLYKEILKHENEVTMRESNTMVEAIPLPDIDTPHGSMEGWYYPIHYDRAMDGGPKKTQLLSPVKNVRTYRGWERKRTGSAGPIDLSLDPLDMDMNRRIHDVAYREVLRDFRKIINDSGLKTAISKHMGRHYVDMLQRLHDDIAMPYKADSGAMAAANKYSEWFRSNTIFALVGLKIGTVMKHVPSTFVQSMNRVGVLGPDFYNAAASLMMTNDKAGVNNWNFVYSGGKVGDIEFTGSREIQRRWRHWAVAHGLDTITFRANTIRETLMDWSSRPIAAGDMLSSVILWKAVYDKSMRESQARGLTLEKAHVEADTRADFAVRQTHGSTSIVSRPEFMRRTGATARWFTSLYAYYNHVYGNFYRMAWQTKDLVRERQRGDPHSQSIPQYASRMAGDFMTYVALPAAFYWLAQDYLLSKEDDEDESLAWKMAKPVIHNVGGAFLGVRDVLGFVAGGGQQPSPGIIGVPLQRAWEVGKRVEKAFDPDKNWTEKDTGKFIRDLHAFSGIAAGLSNDQVGMWHQFIHNYMQAIEEPEGPADVYRGLRRGTIERRKK